MGREEKGRFVVYSDFEGEDNINIDETDKIILVIISQYEDIVLNLENCVDCEVVLQGDFDDLYVSNLKKSRLCLIDVHSDITFINCDLSLITAKLYGITFNNCFNVSENIEPTFMINIKKSTKEVYEYYTKINVKNMIVDNVEFLSDNPFITFLDISDTDVAKINYPELTKLRIKNVKSLYLSDINCPKLEELSVTNVKTSFLDNMDHLPLLKKIIIYKAKELDPRITLGDSVEVFSLTEGKRGSYEIYAKNLHKLEMSCIHMTDLFISNSDKLVEIDVSYTDLKRLPRLEPLRPTIDLSKLNDELNRGNITIDEYTEAVKQGWTKVVERKIYVTGVDLEYPDGTLYDRKNSVHDYIEKCEIQLRDMRVKSAKSSEV